MKDQRKHLKEKIESSTKSILSLLIHKQNYYKAGILLTNYSFIKANVNSNRITGLLADCKSFIEKASDNYFFKNVNYIYLTLSQIEHLLIEDPKQFPSLFYGSLDESFSEIIYKIKEDIENNIRDIWLKPIQATLPTKQGSLFKEIKAHETLITSLEVSKNKKYIFSGTEEGNLCVWETKKFDLIYNVDFEPKGAIKLIKELYSNKLLILLDVDLCNIWIIWDLKQTKELYRIQLQNLYKDDEILEEKQKVIIDNSLTQCLIKNTEQENYLILLNAFDFSETSINCHSTVEDFTFFEYSNNYEINLGILCITTYKEINGKLLWIQKVNNRYQITKELILENFDESQLILFQEQQLVYVWNSLGQFTSVNLITGEKQNYIDFLEGIDTEFYVSTVLPLKSSNRVIVFSSDENIRWWDIRQKYCYKEEKGDVDVVSEIIENGSFAYTNDGDKYDLKIWNLNTGNLFYNLHNITAKKMHFRFLNESLASSVIDTDIFIWNFSNEQEVKPKHNEAISKIDSVNNEFYISSYDGRIFVTNSDQSIIKNIKGTGIETTTFCLLNRKNTTYIAYAVGGVSTENSSIHIWNVTINREESVFEAHKSSIDELRYIENENYLLSISKGNGVIKVWDLKKPSPLYVLNINASDPKEKVFFETFDNSTKLITTSREEIKIWDIKSGKEIKNKFTGKDNIVTVEFLQKKDLLAIGYENQDIRIWNVKQQQLLFQKKIQQPASKIAFPKSRNEQFLCISGSNIELWNTNTQRQEKKYLGLSKRFIFLQYFKNDTLFISSTIKGEVSIWDVQTFKIITRINVGRNITYVKLSEDEKTIIIGEFNGQIHFLSIENL